MKVLVAGKGFIGSGVGDKLEEEDHEVKYLDLSDADFEVDITEEFEIDEYFDVLIHTIGLPPGFCSEEEYKQVHVKGTENIVRAVDCGKVIYLSALRAGEMEHPFFWTKREAEMIVENSGTPYVNVRPSIVYDEGNKLLELMAKFSFTRVFPRIGTMNQPIHREDLVDVVLRSIEDRHNEVVRAAGPEKVSLSQIGRHLYREKGRKCFLLPFTKPLIEVQFNLFGFLPPPLNRENIELLRTDNVTDRNDAEDMVDLTQIFGQE